jgi:CheY-like chemotaxis protein
MAKVLVIDDDESVRKMLRFRLKNSHEILDTSSPKEGLIQALQQKPDVILVDLMMPGHTGFEVCQTLASLCFTELTPIFVISGAPKAHYKDFCERLGAKGYFEKPIDFDLLERRLQAAVSKPGEALRKERRIRLRLGIKLQGTDSTGKTFEVLTSTENVSRHGFACGVNVSLKQNAVVQVFLWEPTAHRFAGQAVLVWREGLEIAAPRCGFRFLEEPREWIF